MCPIDGYFDTIFGAGGDLNTVPDATQPSGTVSYQQGFPVLYSTPVTSGGYNVPRTAINQLFYDVTSALQGWQQNTIAPFITSSMNGGSAYSYPEYAIVMNGGVAYVSLQASNTDTPPSSKWAIMPAQSVVYSGTAPSTGSANAQIVAVTKPTGFADITGNIIYFQAGFTNTSDTTLTVEGISAAHIFKNVYNGLTLLTGEELQVGGAYCIYVTQGGTYVLTNPTTTVPNVFSVNPTTPTGTTSTTFVMQGLDGTITPKDAGVIKVDMAGDITNSSTGGSIVQLAYGTGTPPSNGAAATGTSIGNPVQISPDVASNLVPFSCSGIITGLTPGTAYWIDAQLKTVTSGTATINNLSLTAFEIK
jgi:hypothetical protein